MRNFIIIGFLSWGILSCNKEESPNFNENPDYFPGGANTVLDESPGAFGQVNPNLNNTDELLFFVGNSFFRQGWVSAPASTTARDGLGPIFNARSCSSCHFNDGRGLPKDNNSSLSEGFLMRLSVSGQDQHGGPKGHPIYGDQLQIESVLNNGGEGRVEVSYEYLTVQYADGSMVELRKPIYTVYDENGNVLQNVMTSPRVGQQMIGLGLLEAIDENDILNYASQNVFGVSGKANYVYDVESNSTKLGRFGWKANQPTIRQQVAGAFNGDMGITSSIFYNINHGASQMYDTLANGGEPEIDADDFDKTVLYAANLAVPARRNYFDDDVRTGQALFKLIGCASCHKESYTTGSGSIFPSLNNQKIYPYTDMLLHDMGEDLADGRPDYLADGNEWRTAPLWGVGLIPVVNNHSYLLHDGRARSVEEAILWHGGESEQIIENFKKLSQEERQQVIDFVNSL